jgi:DNA-binding NarL/FixJ family response regulator
MSRIIIADPDISTRKALALLLSRRMGMHDICEAENGDILFHRLEDYHPDILFLCDTLPGLTIPADLFPLREKYPVLKVALLSVDEAAVQIARACKIEFIHKGASPERTLEQLSTIVGDQYEQDRT